mgnify:CR=1 FL=1
MKATVERATLLKCLGHVQSVVERRNTIPILSNVLIEAEEGGLKLTATDLDLQVVDSIAAQVETGGAVTVSAHTLFDIVRKLPDGSQVALDAAEEKMQIRAGRARFNLATLPRDDFPMIAESDLPTSFNLPGETLAEIKTSIDLPWYKEWTGVDVKTREENIEHVFGELTGKKVKK